MDLFRHRSQSAVSADDKRKAVSLITDLFPKYIINGIFPGCHYYENLKCIYITQNDRKKFH